MQVSRRGVLIGTAAGGGLLVAWALRPRTFPAPLVPGKGEHGFGAWLKIAQDGVITVAVPQLEMGQGITTLLPQIVCTELGADWRQIGVEAPPASGAFANIPLAAQWAPLWMPLFASLADDPGDMLAERFAQINRFTATADGTSLAAFETPCREAAATARHLLIAVAAARWGVTPEECEAINGFVIHQTRRFSFGSLAADAASGEAPDIIPLRIQPASEQPFPGALESEGADAAQAWSPPDFPRLDLPSKVDGTFVFAGDVRLPDMLYAAIKHGPVEQSQLAAFDVDAIVGDARITNVVKGKRWLAAVATDWWSAERAVQAMKPRFDVANAIDSMRVEERLTEALTRQPAHIIASRGKAVPTEPEFSRRYHTSAALHGTLETATVTARFADGKLELWMASQAPEAAREAAATAIGLDAEDVILYPMAAGGSFDRRLEHDHAIEAALIAREVSQKRVRPVQLIWSRWQEHLAGLPRSAATALLWAELRRGEGGGIGALRTRIAAPSAGLEFGNRLFGNKTPWSARKASLGKPDAMAVAGAMPPYAIPHIMIEHVPVDTGYGAGRLRANAHGQTAFFTESFMDEVAAELSREPLSFRIEMLGDDPRMVACLQGAARLAQWDGGRDGSGQGLACHVMQNGDRQGRIACIANARRDGEKFSGSVRVSRMSATVDIGRIVNLDIARQQIEGGLIFGLGLALGSATQYRRGIPTAQRLAHLDLPRLADCPDIAITFVPSTAPPFDPGELGVAVCAPAIANALFSATGVRYRRLPLLSEGI